MLPVNTTFNIYDDANFNLDVSNIQKIEQAECVDIGEKVRLLALILGKRWICDIKLKNQSDRKNILKLLEECKLPYVELTKPSRFGGTVTWLTVCANDNVRDFVASNAPTMSPMDAGVLYGYPHTHILAFVGFIKRKKSVKKNVAEHYLSGVFSAQYYQAETEYFESIWRDLCIASPIITNQAIFNHSSK